MHGAGFPLLRISGGSEYFACLLDGMIDGAFRHGYTLGLCPKLFSSTPEDAMADGRFDGLIWYSTLSSEESLELVRRCSVPMVLLHSQAETFDNRYPTVICDNQGGIRLALEHLAALGHKRIAFAYNAEMPFSESTIRCEAFLEVGRTIGLTPSVINILANSAGISQYIQSGPKHTAIIAQNEGLAADFSIALQSAGFRVPEDISIIGFDSTMYCELQKPTLTSISQPLTQMGALAVDLLVQVIDGEIPNPLETIVPCGLDVRASTAHVKGELL